MGVRIPLFSKISSVQLSPDRGGSKAGTPLGHLGPGPGVPGRGYPRDTPLGYKCKSLGHNAIVTGTGPYGNQACVPVYRALKGPGPTNPYLGEAIAQ
jgi:hypothetical protein